MPPDDSVALGAWIGAGPALGVEAVGCLGVGAVKAGLGVAATADGLGASGGLGIAGALGVGAVGPVVVPEVEEHSL